MEPLKKALLWSAIVVAVWLGICVEAGVMAMDWALHPGRRPLTADAEAQAAAVATQDRAVLEEATVIAVDGVTLHAWFVQPLSGNQDAVILLHGQADNRAGMLGTAEMLLRHGYSVLLPDARAHGQSGGALATYGVVESGDIRAWFEWVERQSSPRCIDGLGDSMGAAQILQSLKSTPGFCAVVAESAFANFREASFDRIGEWLGTGPWVGRTVLRPVVVAGILYARWKYGIDMAEANPGQSVAESRVPVLLIHGLLDNNLPPRHSETIMVQGSRRNREISLWEPRNAGHCGASVAEPEEYERRVIGWLEAHERVTVQ